MSWIDIACSGSFPMRIVNRLGAIIQVNGYEECLVYVRDGWMNILGIGQEFSLNIFYPLNLGKDAFVLLALLYLFMYIFLSNYLRQKLLS